jgi:hypothetical protein
MQLLLLKERNDLQINKVIQIGRNDKINKIL